MYGKYTLKLCALCLCQYTTSVFSTLLYINIISLSLFSAIFFTNDCCISDILDHGSLLSVGGSGSGVFQKRLGFLFDSALTAFLMMGNLSPVCVCVCVERERERECLICCTYHMTYLPTYNVHAHVFNDIAYN